MHHHRISALAAFISVATLAVPACAQSNPGLTIHAGAVDGLLLVGQAASTGNPPVDLLRLLLPDPGHATDGTPVTIAGMQPTQCTGAKSVVMHPSGRFVYTTSDAEVVGSVCGYEFDPKALTLRSVPGSPFRAGRGTNALAIDVHGRFVYAANYVDGTITGYSVDWETGQLNELRTSPFVSADANTRFLAVDPLGRFLYSTNSQPNGTVSGFAIDLESGSLTPVPRSPLAIPTTPGALAVDPRGRYLYVAASPNQVYAIDAANGQLVATGATFGPEAAGIAFDPLGRYLFTSSGTGAASRLRAWRVDGSGTPVAVDAGVPTGSGPLGIAVSRTGRHVYTANEVEGNISGFRINDASGALTPIEGSPFPGAARMATVATFGGLPSNESWVVNEPLARGIVATGGRRPYHWVIAKGTLPPGMSFSSDIAVIAGTPTTLGTYTFTARMTEEFGGVVSRDYTFTVRSELAPVTALVLEYYNIALDHYFITWIAGEIAALDAGTVLKGWARTGKSFNAYIAAQPGTSPICRYYIPPALGDSHFFGRGTVECNATGAANASFVLEAPDFMQMVLPVAGTCPANTTPVYRVFSNRPDANHRYTTERAVRDSMVAKGWLAEGDGADLVVMCAPT